MKENNIFSNVDEKTLQFLKSLEKKEEKKEEKEFDQLVRYKNFIQENENNHICIFPYFQWFRVIKKLFEKVSLSNRPLIYFISSNNGGVCISLEDLKKLLNLSLKEEHYNSAKIVLEKEKNKKIEDLKNFDILIGKNSFIRSFLVLDDCIEYLF